MTPQTEEARRLLRLARRDRETFDLLLPLPRASIAALEFRYDDEIVMVATREELDVMLGLVLPWAESTLSGAPC